MDVFAIAQIVYWHRKKAGLSRERCAQLAGVGKTAVYDLEHAKPTIQLDTLMKILDVLNIQVRLESQLMEQYQHE
ncbi:MAG: helix-turn-helix transcriptional regulator [Saprospiraceae bacterium]|jgi:transcriptional regulator with XRE-family HTH domain|nr:helix-turn-helix transcriptional regulator [Saprospiraceae bacterium]